MVTKGSTLNKCLGSHNMSICFQHKTNTIFILKPEINHQKIFNIMRQMVAAFFSFTLRANGCLKLISEPLPTFIFNT